MGSVPPSASTSVRAGSQAAAHATPEGVGRIADGLAVAGMAIEFLKASNGCPKALLDRLQAIHVEYRSVANDLTDAYRTSGSAIRAQDLCAAIIELRNALGADLDLARGLGEEDRSALDNLLAVPARFAPYLQ